jgi:hypothetical protein
VDRRGGGRGQRCRGSSCATAARAAAPRLRATTSSSAARRSKGWSRPAPSRSSASSAGAAPRRATGSFELQLDDARRPFAGEEQLLERISGLLEPRWTPDAATIARWPARIRWRVRALDASRAEIGRSAWVEVERVPR